MCSGRVDLGLLAQHVGQADMHVGSDR